MSTESRVLSVIEQNIKPHLRQSLRLDSDLRLDLGLDSLGIVSVLFACEELLGEGVELASADVNVKVVRTVRDVIELVDRVGPQASHAH